MKSMKLVIVFALVLGLFLMSAPAPSGNVQAARSVYDYYVIGNPNDVVTPTTGGLALMGGGAEVDAAYQWMINRSGGGDFVVLRASGADDYDPYIYGLGTVDSVETIVFKTRDASFDEFVVQTIRNAEALFIAGGDQWHYVSFWKGTPVEDAIHYLAAKGVPIGGKSAGLAVLGEYSFSAENGSAYSDDALADPYYRRVTLERDFITLPNMDGAITDSHFVARDRMGRLVTFLARIVQDGWSTQAKGIGIDEGTVVLVEPNGAATLAGVSAAYFMRTSGPPEVCQSRTPLTFRNISVYRVSGSGTFNLAKWTGRGGVAFTLSAENGVLTSTQPGGEIY